MEILKTKTLVTATQVVDKVRYNIDYAAEEGKLVTANIYCSFEDGTSPEYSQNGGLGTAQYAYDNLSFNFPIGEATNAAKAVYIPIIAKNCHDIICNIVAGLKA